MPTLTGPPSSAFGPDADYALLATQFGDEADVERRNGNLENYGGLTMNRGVCLSRLGRYEEAIACYDDAMPFIRTHGEPLLAATCLDHRADALWMLQRLDEVRRCLEEALVMYRRHGSVDAYAHCVLKYGACLRVVGQGPLARRVLEDALPELKGRAAPALYAQCLSNFALLESDLGFHERALPHYREAEALLREHGHPLDHASAMINCASCLGELGWPADAQALYEEALPILRDGRREGYAKCLWSLADLRMLNAGGSAEVLIDSLAMYEEAAAVLEQHGFTFDSHVCRIGRASCLHALGRHDEAIAVAKGVVPALRGHHRPDFPARGLNILAYALDAVGRTDEARATWDEQLRLCREIGEPLDEMHWRALMGLARMRTRTGDDLRGAERLIDDALTVVERLGTRPARPTDRLGVRLSYGDVYRLACRLALDRGDLAKAFTVTQRAKARTLSDMWQDRAGETRSANRDAARSFDEIAALLAADEMLLECFALNDMTVVFAIQRTGVHVYQIDDATVSSALSEWHGVIARATDPFGWLEPEMEPADILARLYDGIIAPALRAASAPPTSHLIISPSGWLHAVPFAALHRATGTETRSLFDEVAISFVPSANAFWRSRRPAAARVHGSWPPRLLAVAPFADAVPAMRDEQPASRRVTPRAFDQPLAHSRREVEEVARLFADAFPEAARSDPLLGDQASIDAVRERARDAAVILLATHGAPLRLGEHVLDFRLRFRGTPGPDHPQTISLRQVVDGFVSVNACLVVLTACHLGEVVSRGEEALGFGQAFLLAGAGAVLAPLWPVDDAATAEFSIAFHRALLGDDRPSLAEAWRCATAHVRAIPGWEHPYFWGAFVLIGDGSLRLVPPERGDDGAAKGPRSWPSDGFASIRRAAAVARRAIAAPRTQRGDATRA